MTAPTPPRVYKRGIIAEVVDTLTDEHRDRVWIDRDGDIWAWRSRTDQWMCWTPGAWEVNDGMTPEGFGPFTEVRRVDQ